MSVIVKLLSKFDDSGIKKAQHGFGGLKKTLAGIGIGLGLKAVADVLVESAKAASADAKSIKLMNMQLTKNAGASKESLKQNDKFIESLSLQTGILDDNLRPSLAKFGNVTKNVKQAQKLLKLSLDVTAGSGKSQTKVANALAKAYAGNTKSLIGMFPELKNSKNALADLTKEFSGAALANADPFMRFTNSLDILKEKLGKLVLPLITDFVDNISKPGGLVDEVGKFFEAVGNPKTEVGKAFGQLKESIGLVGKSLVALFALMDPKTNDSMTGFANFIKVLSDGLTFLTDTVTFLGGALSALFTGDFNRFLDLSNTSLEIAAEAVRRNMSVAATVDAVNAEVIKKGKGFIYSSNGQEKSVSEVIFGGKPTGQLGSGVFKNGKGFAQQQTNNNVTINVQGADPKAVVDALGKYYKTNGGLPTYLFPGIKKTP
jgi:hypothetical protein